MKIDFVIAAAACGAALVLCSCNTQPAEWDDGWITQDIVAAPAAAEQIRVDGEVSDGEWNDAQEYQLSRAQDWGYENLLPRQRKREDTTPFERGYFKVKYDAENLYVLAVLEDEDIVQTAKVDDALFGPTGDAVAVFLKPADQSGSCGIFGTPWGNKSAFLFPWAGYSLMEPQKSATVRVAALAREVADPEKDKAGWIVEMAVPKALLEQTGGVFAADKDWRVLLYRFNYGKSLPSGQLSSTPKLPRTDFSLTDYYAKLKFKPMPEGQKAPEAKPAVDEKKAPEAKPAVDKKKSPEAKPAVDKKKAPEAKPAVDKKKAPEAKPAVDKKKSPEAKPTVDKKKSPEAKPVAKVQKAPEVKPVAKVQKAPEAKPAVKENNAPEAKPVAKGKKAQEQK